MGGNYIQSTGGAKYKFHQEGLYGFGLGAVEAPGTARQRRL